MNIKYILIIISLNLTFSAISQTDTERIVNHSTLILKMNYNSYGFRGFGGKLIIRNKKTNELYESQTKKGLNPFIIIEDLPNGIYEVEQLEIISGGPILIIREDNFFDVLKIDSPKNYYLGNYITKKIKPIFKFHIEVSSIEKDTEETIFKQLKKRSDKWLDIEVEFEKRLFKEDKTKIIIKK